MAADQILACAVDCKGYNCTRHLSDGNHRTTMSMRDEDRAAILAAAQKIREANAAAMSAEAQKSTDRAANSAAWLATVHGAVRPVLHDVLDTLRHIGVSADIQFAAGNEPKTPMPTVALVWGRNHGQRKGTAQNEWRLTGNFATGKLEGTSTIFRDGQATALTDTFAVPDTITPEWVSESVATLVKANLPLSLNGKVN